MRFMLKSYVPPTVVLPIALHMAMWAFELLFVMNGVIMPNHILLRSKGFYADVAVEWRA
jgi:hypothetical protein